MCSGLQVMIWRVELTPIYSLSLSQMASSRPSWTSSWLVSLLRMDTLGWRYVWHQPGLKSSSWLQGNYHLQLILSIFCTSYYGYIFVCCPFNCLQDPECSGREGPKDQRVDRCGPEEVWLPRGQRRGKWFGMNWDCIVCFIVYLTNVPCVVLLTSAVRWEGCHSWSVCHCPGRVLALQVAGRPGCA